MERRKRDALERLGREEDVEALAVLVVDLAVEEDPVLGCVRVRERQLCGSSELLERTRSVEKDARKRICFAERTRHGSASVDELRILRA